MLCEGAVRFMQQAMEAIRDNNPQTRYEKLTRTSEIVLALRTALDTSSQDRFAIELARVYQSLDTRILSLHQTRDLGECAAVLEELRHVRDAWDAVAMTQSAAAV